MNRVNDLTGRKFGKLTVLKRDESARPGRSKWVCECDCGNMVSVYRNHLVSGQTVSCGCASKYINLKPIPTGTRFGKLTVIEITDRKHRSTYMYSCKCDCGNYTNASSANLKSGNVISCGCHRVESAQTHGLSKTRIYRIYSGMKSRCLNENYHAYKHYGGRGINICDELLGGNGFQDFYDWSMENGYADNLTIDRKDNYKGYSPDNCRWVTQETQARNKRSNLS